MIRKYHEDDAVNDSKRCKWKWERERHMQKYNVKVI